MPHSRMEVVLTAKLVRGVLQCALQRADVLDLSPALLVEYEAEDDDERHVDDGKPWQKPKAHQDDSQLKHCPSLQRSRSNAIR